MKSIQYHNQQKQKSPTRLKQLPQHLKCAKGIIHAFPDPLIVLDKNLLVHFANEAFCKTFKVFTTTDGHFYEFDNKQWDIPPLKKLLNNILTKPISEKTTEITHTFRSVGQKTMFLRAKRVSLEKDNTEFILLIIQDITKQKFIETQKDDFVGFVTHELKTPVTSLHTFVEILQAYHTKTNDKKSQFLLSKIAIQMKRLISLLHSFSNVYKMQTGKLILNKEPININLLVKEIVNTFQYISETHGVIAQGEIKHWVLADKDRINEVLVNLITNAIKYSPNADSVIINLSETEKDCIISVQDFGFGIPQEEQEKIFERFFRARKKKQYNIKGLGLGLYITSQIIKQHKGKLWVKSTLNEGSTFFFSLPKIKPLL